MSHSSPPGMKYNRSSLLSLENNYRHANGGAKTLTIKKLKSVYYPVISFHPDPALTLNLTISLFSGKLYPDAISPKK